MVNIAQRAKHPCSHPICPKLTHTKYCEQHKVIEDKEKAESQKYYNEHKRDKDSDSFYQSKEWKHMRKYIFGKYHGLCGRCKQLGLITPGNVVDHILPLKQRHDLRLTESNLWVMCHKCHNSKTFSEK